MAKDILGKDILPDDEIIVAHPFESRNYIIIADVTDVGIKWVYWEGVDKKGDLIKSKCSGNNCYRINER